MMETIFRHPSSPVDRRRICFPVVDSFSIGVSLVTGLLFDPENRMDKKIILEISIFIIFWNSSFFMKVYLWRFDWPSCFYIQSSVWEGIVWYDSGDSSCECTGNLIKREIFLNRFAGRRRKLRFDHIFVKNSVKR